MLGITRACGRLRRYSSAGILGIALTWSWDFGIPNIEKYELRLGLGWVAVAFKK